MILDSNIIIYRSKGIPMKGLFDFSTVCVSIVSKIEVLGFPKLSLADKLEYELFFEGIPVLSISEEIANLAIKHKQIRNVSLGDSIIAATALVNDLTLVTANTKDFKWIEGLKLLNPLR